MKRFGVMLDCSRNAVMKAEEVKKIAGVLKSFGYNTLLLYTEDTFEVKGEPYFGYMRGRYSGEELKDIVACCNAIGMEVIPCIQALAHLNQIFRWADYPEINDTGDILLAEEERTYKLLENIFKSLREYFDSEYVHIGMDEAELLGLGKYLHKKGYCDRFGIFNRHLKKVIEISKKYGFKPVMWSDMYFRLANKGEYYALNPCLPEEVRAMTPKEVALVYWDYYHTEKEEYNAMFAAHKQFDNEIWFAGGAWTWSGFAPKNGKTLETMLPAMISAREQGIENILIALWGDDGKECSFYSALPALFAVKRFHEGETDTKAIKKEFEKITGENYEALFALDLPDSISRNKYILNDCCKYMLYSDPFNGYLDATVQEGVAEKYGKYAEKLESLSDSSSYAYLFESEAALCRLLSVKYSLGKRTREVYKNGTAADFSLLIKEYEKAEKLLEIFYRCFYKLWYRENKPQGFDVQELRLGGLACRLRSCRERLETYADNRTKTIPELEEELLPLYAFGRKAEKGDTLDLNDWRVSASVNII